MVPQGPTGEERTWPYFFLSHAHPKGAREADHPETIPRRMVHELFTELCWHLREICEPIDGDDTSMGMMDSEIEVGVDWGRWLSKQLATCRVFVPLLCSAYFRSDMCGREWAAFVERPTEPRHLGREHTGAIVPVYWAPVLEGMPEAASKLQNNSGDFPPSYQQDGLYSLMVRPKMREDRQETIFLLAARIRDVAYRTRIEAGKIRPNLDEVRNIFATEPGPPRFRIGPGPGPGTAAEVAHDHRSEPVASRETPNGAGDSGPRDTGRQTQAG